jgi:hypothetical protein
LPVTASGPQRILSSHSLKCFQSGKTSDLVDSGTDNDHGEILSGSIPLLCISTVHPVLGLIWRKVLQILANYHDSPTALFCHRIRSSLSVRDNFRLCCSGTNSNHGGIFLMMDHTSAHFDPAYSARPYLAQGLATLCQLPCPQRNSVNAFTLLLLVPATAENISIYRFFCFWCQR